MSDGHADVQRMTIAEFRELGYLQEINRRLLHPLGLALEVFVDTDGTERLGGVWDYRDDPEGMRYGDEGIDWALLEQRADAFDAEWERRSKARCDALGYMVQPSSDAARTANHPR